MIFYNTDELWKRYAKWTKPVINICIYIWYDFIYIEVQNKEVYRERK